MGRTTRWLRSLFSTSRKPSPSSKSKAKAKANWATSDGVLVNNPYGEGQLDANKHAIAVAAATAAVAEAALAAAQAAAEVVRLTSGGVSTRNDGGHDGGERRRVVAAVKIQSAFRAYLAKRALRALRGLVKLQALVRGHIVRKQSADMLRRMQAMARIQARASVHRSYLPEPTNKFNFSHHPFVTNQRHYDQHLNNPRQSAPILKQYNPISQKGGSSHQTSNWLHHWMDQYAWNTHHGDDERTDKILEIDTWKPRQPIKRPETTTPTSQHLSSSETARLSAKLQKPSPSVSSEEVSSAALSLKYPQEGDQGGAACTTENSPRVHSTLSKHSRGPFTPTKSDTRSLFGNYVGHPSYMANTASSMAKVRSQSAPKQRMQLEELGRSHGLWEPDSTSEMGFPLPSNFRSNTAYLNYSGQLRRPGTPARGAYTGFSSSYGHRL